MVNSSDDNVVRTLNKDDVGENCETIESTKTNIHQILKKIRRFQMGARKYIEDNHVNFMPNLNSADIYLSEGVGLTREAQTLLENVRSTVDAPILDANAEITNCTRELQEVLLGLRLSNLILEIDDLFECVETANASKEYLVVLELLSKLKNLIYENRNESDVYQLLAKCDCYETIKVKYQIQAHILKQNLQQKFERLVEFTEKQFPHSKSITIQVSKNVKQLQDICMALFQAHYNPNKLCDFLFLNCFQPLVLKPVSVEYVEDNSQYFQLTLSYTFKDLGNSLRPSYKAIFENIKIVFQCLSNINVHTFAGKHVFTILGDHIKHRLLPLLIDECLMYAIPENIDDFQNSTLIEDVLEFEHFLADIYFINLPEDPELSKFTEKYETYFYKQFCEKLFESATDIMERDLQDMTQVAEKNTADDIVKNPLLFPACMVSKSTLELIKLIERILHECKDMGREGEPNILNVVDSILNSYITQVPKIHEKLLESIPQQSVMLYNNCMFLAHWVTKNAEEGIPTYPVLVKSFQATATKYLNLQLSNQEKIIMGIINELDFTNVNSLSGTVPKAIRQCLRQLDLLRNVWQNVLPDNVYNKSFCTILNKFCEEIICQILSMEDIPVVVAKEFSDVIDLVLDKGPLLFKEKHEVLQIKSWMKFKQLKMILNASLQEIVDQWCEGAGILTADYRADEVKHLIRALFQNTDRRATALDKIT